MSSLYHGGLKLESHRTLSDQMRLRDQRWVHGFKGHAGSGKVVVIQPNGNISLKGKNLRRRVLLPSKTLLTNSEVKALDEGLLVFLVRASHTMVVGSSGDQLGELSLKLRAAIGLDGLAVTKASHKGLEGGFSIFGGQAGSQHDLSFAREDIHGCEGEYIAKVNGIHLDDLTWPACPWQ